MRTAVAAILACLTVLSFNAWGAEDTTERERHEAKRKAAQDILDVKGMVVSYKRLRSIPTGKIRPRILAVVLIMVDPKAKELKEIDDDPKHAPEIAAKLGLPYYDGARFVILLTKRGWGGMLLKRGIELKADQVVEVDLPAATDFRDLDNMDKIKADLINLQLSGAYGVQSIRPDCVQDKSDKKIFSIKCNGKTVSNVVNDGQFRPSALNWLTFSPSRVPGRF